MKKTIIVFSSTVGLILLSLRLSHEFGVAWGYVIYTILAVAMATRLAFLFMARKYAEAGSMFGAVVITCFALAAFNASEVTIKDKVGMLWNDFWKSVLAGGALWMVGELVIYLYYKKRKVGQS